MLLLLCYILDGVVDDESGDRKEISGMQEYMYDFRNQQYGATSRRDENIQWSASNMENQMYFDQDRRSTNPEDHIDTDADIIDPRREERNRWVTTSRKDAELVQSKLMAQPLPQVPVGNIWDLNTQMWL